MVRISSVERIFLTVRRQKAFQLEIDIPEATDP